MVDTRRQKRRREKADSERQTGVAPPRTIFSLSEDETFDLGRTLGRGLRGGELVLLQGELGLGKTVFARGVATGIGVPTADVSSPSFTLVQEYQGGRVPVFHVDLYRVELPDEIGTLGIEEIVAAGGVVLIEWGEKLPPYLRRGATVVRFFDLGEGSRQIEIVNESRRPKKRVGDA